MVVANALIAGKTPPQIATRLAKKRGLNKRERMLLLYQIHNWINRDQVINHLLAEAAQANMKVGLPKMTEALARRGKRGRVDAIKLAMEATGFHNPRIQHEHSGEVKITLNVPRPSPVEDVTDADVVE